MTETNQAQDLLATLRAALHQLEYHLELTREGIDQIASHVERLHAGIEALGTLRQREDTSVGIDMLVDAAAALLHAFQDLESGLLDAQADVDTLEAELTDEDTEAEA